jgi:hypothetical protein
MVAFYRQLGDGSLAEIGRATSAPIAPGPEAVEAVFVSWDTSSAGETAHLVAVIDPDGSLAEAVTSNNRVERTVALLPAAGDSIPPSVTSLLANGGAPETSSPEIALAITAEDDGGSGVASMYLVEREFNSAARQWIAVQNIGWIPFQENYALTLTSRGGVRYIQAWVSDRAGNISAATVKARINYIPPADRLLAGQVRLYRRTLAAGQTLNVTLTTLRGDADLYVWRPDGGQSWVSNRPGTEVDSVSFTAPVDGDYQIEAYGYTTSEYQLAVELGAAGVEVAALDLASADKVARAQPVVSPMNEPAGTVAVPPAPVADFPELRLHLYLPAVTR